MDVVKPPDALRDKRIEPRLRACTLRLLSVRPQERGTAAELAEALEQLAAPELEPAAAPRSPPLPVPIPARPPEALATAAPGSTVASRKRRLLLALAVAVLLALGAGWMGTRLSPDASSLAGAKAASRSKAETTGLGEAAIATLAPASLHVPNGLTEDALPEPLPEQVRPDSKGRCPHKKQVALNGGCWVEMPSDRENCEALTLSGHRGSSMFKNKCYVPVLIQPGRQPSSAPATTP